MPVINIDEWRASLSITAFENSFKGAGLVMVARKV
jgi:hypothetical protein